MVFKFNKKLKFLMPLIGLLFSLAVPAVSAKVAVQGARLWDGQEHTRVVIETTGPVAYTLFTLNHPNRVVIDIDNATLGKDWLAMEYQGSLINRIRTGSHEDRTLRIVFDLNQMRLGKGLKSESFILKPEGPHGHRLVVDLFPNQQRPVGSRGVPKNRLESPSSQDNSPKRVARNPVAAQAPEKQKTRVQQAKVTKQSRPKAKVSKKLFWVAIDAGHGGEDPGAKGRRGTQEKIVVLQIAKRLQSMINAHKGMAAVLIRKGDYRLSLGQRLDLARQKNPDLFVSIHADAARNKKARGATVYTLSNKGAAQAADRWLDDDRKKVKQLADITDWNKKDPMLKQVILDLSQTATLEASQALADYVLRSMKRSVPIHAGKTKRAAYAVLKAPDIPSILVETAFLSNGRDEKRLRTPRFQAKMARAIYRGIEQYYRHYPHQVPSKQHVISRGETLSSIARQYQVNVQHLREHNGINGNKLRPGDIIHLP